VGYELEVKGPGRFCTHGPDPAPEGVDLERRVTTAEIQTSSRGVASTAVPCHGDGSTGNRVEAIYARASTTPDRYASVVAALRVSAAEDVQDIVFNSSGGARSVRFVTTNQATGPCELHVRNVVLSPTSDDLFQNTITELRAKGYKRADRKYLVWMDIPGGGTGGPPICGIGSMALDDVHGAHNANNGHPDHPGQIARVDTPCWGSVLPATDTPVEAHELFHTFGAVQDSSPNSTFNPAFTQSGGHCTDNYDAMCYDDDGVDDFNDGNLNNGSAWGNAMTIACPTTSDERLLDCNDDDYFNVSPAAGTYLANFWNTANTSFLVGAPDVCTKKGTPANNTMTGTSGVDVFCGMGGNDLIKVGPRDIVFGGSGNDTVEAAGFTQPLFGIMSSRRIGPVNSAGDEFVNPAIFHTDVENLRGGSNDDFLVGNGAANKLFGGGGNDNLQGMGGNDILDGGGGNDNLLVDGGNDKLIGGSGSRDMLVLDSSTKPMKVDLAKGTVGGLGTDRVSSTEWVYGSPKADTIRGTNGANLLDGRAGNDILYGRGGGDSLYGGDGSDRLFGDAGNDYLNGQAGADSCNGGSGFNAKVSC
jgi:Ca2+-binding RTX toxin-like protein